MAFPALTTSAEMPTAANLKPEFIIQELGLHASAHAWTQERLQLAKVAFEAEQAKAKAFQQSVMDQLEGQTEAIARMTQEMTGQASRLAEVMTALDEEREKLLQMDGRITQVEWHGSSRGGGGERERQPRFDHRQLRVKPYDGIKKEFWREFLWIMGTFVGRQSGTLKKAMDRMETFDKEITTEVLDEWGVTSELDSEIATILQNFTQDESPARSLLQAHSTKPGLEQMRKLHVDAIPRGGAQATLKRKYLIHPP